MSTAVSSPRAPGRLRFVWLLDRRRDLLFYVGSALAGWLYVAVIAYAILRLADPLHDPLATLALGGLEIPLTLQLLVMASWAFLLDAPHVWATLGRVLPDPDEWRERRSVLLRSFGWFAVGPAIILSPYLVGALTARAGAPLAASTLAAGALLFFVLFRLWAYYHVVRQHWGFVSLYRRKAEEGDGFARDRWFFNVAMYAPLVLFMTGETLTRTPGYPDLGLTQPLVAGWSVADVVHPAAWTVYAGAWVLYLAALARDWRRGEALNGTKLLYLVLLLPLHFVAFSHPLMAAFLVPLVTVGHNIQYHAIVYSFGRKKYFGEESPRYRRARWFFKSVPVYFLIGLLFTFGLYRGPWIEWLRDATGLRLDRLLLDSVGMMAGVTDPASLGLGEQLFAAMLLGWAMQHYYLDSKIWRVSRDRDVQRNLGV